MADGKKPVLLGICGSLRKDSSNRKLLRVALARARASGAEVSEIDLLDFPMSPYNEDDQDRDGFPETTKALRQRIADSDGILFAVPEYNWSLPGHFKNIVDWLSRREAQGPFAQTCFKGKFAAMVAGAGGVGGAKASLSHLRHVMTMLGMHVIPEHISLPGARNAFDADGRMSDEKLQAQVEAVGARLVEVIIKLGS